MNTVIVLTGPTGSGKSRMIHELPESLPVEIINADSRQVYRHLNTGTAMPSRLEMERFPHHLFAFLEPAETFSAGQYIHRCKILLDEILSRKKVPVIVGGTFFYIRALWDGLIETENIDKNIEIQVNNMSAEEAMVRLNALDPVRAGQLAPADEYRIKRSLMLCLSTGKPVSSLKKSGGVYSLYNFHAFYPDMDRKILYDRINARVQSMFDLGLLTEISELLRMGYTENDPAMKSIGYREVLALSKEFRTPPDQWHNEMIQKAVEIISKETRNFAKRQLTWFRNEKRLKRIDHVFAVSLLSGLILEAKGRF